MRASSTCPTHWESERRTLRTCVDEPRTHKSNTTAAYRRRTTTRAAVLLDRSQQRCVQVVRGSMQVGTVIEQHAAHRGATTTHLQCSAVYLRSAVRTYDGPTLQRQRDRPRICTRMICGATVSRATHA